MAVAEWGVLMSKYPGFSREEVEGKTEEELRDLYRYKQWLKMPNLVKYRELFKPAVKVAECLLNFMKEKGR